MALTVLHEWIGDFVPDKLQMKKTMGFESHIQSKTFLFYVFVTTATVNELYFSLLTSR